MIPANAAAGYPRGGPATWGARLDRDELESHIDRCVDAVGPAKGRTLEELLGWLLPHIPGFEVLGANVYSTDGAQEVDLGVMNHQHETGFPSFGDTIIAECKNWERPVDSSEVAWFVWKMRQGGVREGILLAANGITGSAYIRSAAWSIVFQANAADVPRRVILITLDDLRRVTSTPDLRTLLRHRVSALAMQTDPMKYGLPG